MVEDVGAGADLHSVLVGEAAGLGDTTSVEVGSVAAAQVDQPELVLVLGVDHGMAARYPLVGQNDVVALGSADIAGALDRGPPTRSIFQPDHGLDFGIHEG